MKQGLLMGAALFAAGLMVVGCEKKDEACCSGSCPAAAPEAVADPAAVAVEVNGEQLTEGALAADVEKIIAMQGDQIPSNQLEYARHNIRMQLAQGFLVKKVMTAKAKELAYVVTDADREVEKAELMKNAAARPNGPKTFEEFLAQYPLGAESAREEFEAGLVIKKLLDGEVGKHAPDFTAKAQEIVDGIVSNNNAAASSEAAALTRITSLKAQLDDPSVTNVMVKFGELAAANSDCPSGKRANGDLDFFARGSMVKEFEEAAFTLPVGKVSDPVKTDFGYHLILVTDKSAAVEAKDGAAAVPEKVRCSHILIKTQKVQRVPELKDVVSYLKSQYERENYGKYVQNAVKAANIKVSDEFKQLLPPEEKPENAPVPLENAAE